MDEPRVTAVIPVYNDRSALSRAIPESLRWLGDYCEVIVAEDGSTDGSRELVEEWAKRDPRVRLLHADERLGRGAALNRAFRAARSPVICYFDVDLATDMSCLRPLIGAVADGGFDIAIGSRLLRESDTGRSPLREVASRVYNLLVRLILKSRVHDHQCGFKAFSRERIIELLPEVEATHWFWDTEVLVRAQRRGWKIAELPVRWREGRGTTVRIGDVFSMGMNIINLWWRLHVEEG
ncbi:MAG: dolichyl-phosphate beta-glucosyltransferase [Methanoculleaceae archaeon]